MRTHLLAAALLVALGGCHAQGSDNNADAANTANYDNSAAAALADIPSMLKAGSPQLCTNSDVERTVFGSLSDRLTDDADIRASLMLHFYTQQDLDLAVQQITPSLDAVTFSGADPLLGSVSCSGNLVIHAGGDLNTDTTHSIDYDIRPTLTPGEEFVVHSNADRFLAEYQQTAVQLARANAARRVAAAQQAAPQQAATPNPTDAASPDLSNAQSTPAPDTGVGSNQQ
jgi:hypothetical protein